MFRLLFSLIAAPLLMLETAALGRHPWFSPLAILNVASYPLIILGSLALHEGGHALVARIVGLDVPLVQLGIGRRVAGWRWGKTRVALHAFPLLGLTYLGAARRDGLRWRFWLALAAGPLVTLAIVAATSHVLWPSAEVAHGLALRELTGSANLLTLVVNLLPLPLLRRGGLLQNDGTQLLTVPFRSQKRLQALLETPVLLEAQTAHERGDHTGALRLLTAALADAPESWALRNSRAVAQLYLGQLVDARASFLELLQGEPEPPDLRWIARNNLAWTDYQLADEALRAEADEHSAAVHARFKQASWAMGTRGAILGWLGRHEEAIALLERAHLRNSLEQHRAFNAAGLVISYAALGDLGAARAWLERARQASSSSPLLPRAQAALASAIAAASKEGTEKATSAV